jgi:hypothetical protein
MITELALASWETIARRTLMAAQGTCSPAEYRRMTDEKMRAALESSLWLARNPGRLGAAALAPWHRRAVANARRLRRKQRAGAGSVRPRQDGATSDDCALPAGGPFARRAMRS